MRTLPFDLRHALRGLARSPIFTLVAILSLALGIGANVGLFSLADRLLWRDLAVAHPERLVTLVPPRARAGSAYGDRMVSYPVYRKLRDSKDLFESLAARFPVAVTLQTESASERVAADFVSSNFFDVLGLRPAGGDFFRLEDDRPMGSQMAVVLSHGAWLQRFGGDPSAVGRTVHVDGQPMTVVGVAPAGFTGVQKGRFVDVYLPLSSRQMLMPYLPTYDTVGQYWLHLIGCLQPPLTAEVARGRLNALARPMLEEPYGLLGLSITSATRKALDRGWQLLPAATGIAGLDQVFSAPLLLLLGATGLVLLIACSNLAGLMLARAAGRQREIAIRRALGASGSDLMRYVLSESLLLACGGGLAGLMVARLTVDMLVHFGPSRNSEWLASTLDGRVLAFASALTLAVVAMISAAPLWRMLRAEVASALTDGTSRVTGAGAVRMRRVLVAFQVALSLVLLVGAGLFARSLRNIVSIDGGMRRGNLLQFNVDASAAGHPVSELARIYHSMLDRLRLLPGVMDASLSDNTLLTNSESSATYQVPGYQPKEGENMNMLEIYVAPEFFRTLGVPLHAGREFQPREDASSPRTAVVNEAFARRFFGDAWRALGRTIAWARGGHEAQIVGVVADTRFMTLREAPRPTVYRSVYQCDDLDEVTVYLRTAAVPRAFVAHVRDELRRFDPTLAMYEVKTLERQIEETHAAERLVAILCSAFGVLATLLAALGLYGVLAYSVAARGREIGIRIALGAERGRVLRLVLREAAVLVAIGLGAGLPAAVGMSVLVRAQLFDLTPYDPFAFGGACLLLTAIACLAAFVPARRAAGVDPIQALRVD